MARLTLTIFLALFTTSFSYAEEGAQQLWLMFHRGSLDGVMTGDLGERDSLQQRDWKINGTGRALLKEVSGALVLHRMVRSTATGVQRMLTVGQKEADASLKAGYQDEGILGYVPIKQEVGELPVYRLSKDDKRLWLMKAEDRDWAQSNGWKDEGVAFWLWTITK